MRLNIILVFLITGFICPFLSYASDKEDQPEREYVKLIEEGKTWEYIYGWGYGYSGNFSAFRMRFEGTEIRNGIEYNKLVYCGNLTTWNTVNYIVRPLIVSDLSYRPNDIDSYYLMREEEGKVYLYIKDLIEKKINPDDEAEITVEEAEKMGDEAIIYDFSKDVGETINNVFCNPEYHRDIYPYSPAFWCCCDMYVNSVSEIDLNGKRSIKQGFTYGDSRFDDYSCIEGVGIDISGFLPHINLQLPTTGFDFSYYYLNSLHDADGNIIFKADEMYYVDIAELVRLVDMDAPNEAPFIGQDGCEVKAENAEISIYDLSGRVVDSGFETVSTASLQPGVYVAKALSSTGISTLKLKVD